MSSTLIPKDLLEAVVCTNCKRYLSVFPIFVKIDNADALCGRCKPADVDEYIRDEAYECMAQFLIFPCQYYISGCQVHLTPQKIESHEEFCEYRKLDCPGKKYTKCQWTGPRSNIIEHFKQKHTSLLMENSYFELNFIQSQEEYLVLLEEGELFLLRKEVDSRKGAFVCSLEHLRAAEDSEVYNYVLKFESGDKNYFYKCPEKSTCGNVGQNNTYLTHDILRERLQDPASIIVNICIVKAKLVEEGSKLEKVGNKDDQYTEDIKMPNVNWDLLSELECPICFDYMLPPIFQCINGHSICNICKTKVCNQCPICKVAIEETKNYVLEKLTQHMVYPCKFHKNGCKFACKSTAIENHQKKCEFGPFNCPLKETTDCPWNGRHTEVMEHINDNHEEFVLGDDKIDIPFDKLDPKDAEKIFLIKYQKKTFRLLYVFENSKFYWRVQLVGPLTAGYKFEIDVVDLSNSKRRCYFTGLVAPLPEHNKCNSHSGEHVVACLEQLDGFITTTLSFRIRIINE